MLKHLTLSASRAGVDADRLYRLLRAAVQLGVFAAAGGGRGGGGGTDAQLRSVRFRNNRLSAVLREDHPNCIRDMVGGTMWLFACINSRRRQGIVSWRGHEQGCRP